MEKENIKYTVKRVTYESTKQTTVFTPAGFTVCKASGSK